MGGEAECVGTGATCSTSHDSLCSEGRQLYSTSQRLIWTVHAPQWHVQVSGSGLSSDTVRIETIIRSKVNELQQETWSSCDQSTVYLFFKSIFVGSQAICRKSSSQWLLSQRKAGRICSVCTRIPSMMQKNERCFKASHRLRTHTELHGKCLHVSLWSSLLHL